MFKVKKARIAVLIGKDGETKSKIENSLGVEITINSSTGDVEINPDPEHPNYDPLNVITAKKVVRAINRGFNPKKAELLMREGYELAVFNLMTILGKSRKRIKRIKGRIIGRGGEIRKAIEKYAECFVSVYGKTVSIVSDYENLPIARKAINMLISGAPHHTVLRYLEDKYNEKKKAQFRQMYKPEF